MESLSRQVWDLTGQRDRTVYKRWIHLSVTQVNKPLSFILNPETWVFISNLWPCDTQNSGEKHCVQSTFRRSQRRSSIYTHTYTHTHTHFRDSSVVGHHRGLISLVLDEIIGPPEKSEKLGWGNVPSRWLLKPPGAPGGVWVQQTMDRPEPERETEWIQNNSHNAWKLPTEHFKIRHNRSETMNKDGKPLAA